MFFNKLRTVPVNRADELALHAFEASFKEFAGVTSLKGGTGSLVDVSIVCLTYNHRKFIERTLFGFLRQKFDYKIEILIYDDHSTDGTVEILQRYANDFPDLIDLVVQPYNKFSRGEAKPHLFFAKARGRYIAYCEGDDFWICENKLSDQYSYLEKNPSVSLTYGKAMFVDGDGVLKDTFSNRSNYVDHAGTDLEKGVNIFTLSAMFRNQFSVIDVKGKNIFLDIILWSQCGEFGRGHFLNSLGPSVYRVHAQGINSAASQTKRFRMLYDTYALLVLHKIKNFRASAINLTLKLIILKLRLFVLERKKNA